MLAINWLSYVISRYSLENQFGSDIDPLGRGGGGMLFDPRNRGRIQQPGGVPFGALPPGKV